MSDFLRLALLLALAGCAVTVAAAGAAWWLEEHRRLTRLITKTLGGPADAAIIAHGRNAAAAVRLESNEAVVLWRGGSNALLYSLDALLGAELIVDDVVAARVYRAEPRRALDAISQNARKVTLRLIFDNVRDPDFDLDLWLPGDENRRGAQGPAAAIQQARNWIARADAILRRPIREPAVTRQPAPQPAPDDEHEDDAALF